MPLIDLRFTSQDFSALALAAHLEGTTLNDFMVAVLKDEATKAIESYERASDEDKQVPSNG